MANIAGIVLSITADTKRAADGINRINTQLDGFAGTAKRLGGILAAGFAGREIVEWGKSAILAASDFNEALSKSQVVFGDYSTDLEKWANESVTALGLTHGAALEAAGTFGNLLTSFGYTQEAAAGLSQQMVQMAADLASFNNVSVDEAITAIRSGLSGEMEPLKRFGITLSDVRLRAELTSQGVTDLGSTLTTMQKSTAAASLIMKDGANAIGDFERTSDGLANKLRILEAAGKELQTAFGRGFLDAFDGATGSSADLAQSLEDLEPVLELIGTRVGEFAAGVGGLSTRIVKLIPGMEAVDEANRKWYDGVLDWVTKNPMLFLVEQLDQLDDATGHTKREIWDKTVVLWSAADAYKGVGGAARAATAPISASGNAAQEAGRKAAAGAAGWAAYFAAAMAAEAAYRNNLVSGTVTSAVEEGFAKGPDPEAIRRTSAFQAEMNKLNEELKKAGGGGGGGRAAADSIREFTVALEAGAYATFEYGAMVKELSDKQADAIAAKVKKVQGVIDVQNGIIDAGMAALKKYDDYIASIRDKVTGGINLDDFIKEVKDEAGKVTGTVFDADGFQNFIASKADVTAAVANLAGQIPEEWAMAILSQDPAKANVFLDWATNNTGTLTAITTSYTKLTQDVTDVWGPMMADAYIGINRDATEQGIIAAKEKIEKEADAFKKFVRSKLKTRIVVEVEYKEVNSPPAAASGAGAVRQVQQFEALNGTSWRT